MRDVYTWRPQGAPLLCPVCGSDVLWSAWSEADPDGLRRGAAGCSTGPMASIMLAGTPMCTWTGAVELDDETSEYRIVPPSRPSEDRGPWMLLTSGIAFFPQAPRPEDVRIDDIATALSRLCRYGGHGFAFYSVAEHSVLMARAARDAGLSLEVQRYALLHDATEAYVVDVPRPVKMALGEAYARIERGVARVIRTRFKLTPSPWVDEADWRILTDERHRLPPDPPGVVWDLAPPLGVKVVELSPVAARAMFMDEARNLGLLGGGVHDVG